MLRGGIMRCLRRSKNRPSGPRLSSSPINPVCSCRQFSADVRPFASRRFPKSWCGRNWKSAASTCTASAAAKLSEGSLGVALRWIEDGVIPLAEELLEKLDRLTEGKSSEGFADWLKKSADSYAEKQLKRDELGSKPAAARDGLAVYLRIAAEHFRRLLGEREDAEEIERVASAIDAISRSEQYLDSYVNAPLVLQQLSLAIQGAFAPVGRGRRIDLDGSPVESASASLGLAEFFPRAGRDPFCYRGAEPFSQSAILSRDHSTGFSVAGDAGCNQRRLDIAGGVGVLVPSLRRFAGWGLVAPLVAVFPANIYMAMHPKQFHIAPRSLLWIRLPVQGLLVWWVWSVSLGTERGERGQCV